MRRVAKGVYEDEYRGRTIRVEKGKGLRVSWDAYVGHHYAGCGSTRDEAEWLAEKFADGRVDQTRYPVIRNKWPPEDVAEEPDFWRKERRGLPEGVTFELAPDRSEGRSAPDTLAQQYSGSREGHVIEYIPFAATKFEIEAFEYFKGYPPAG